MLSPNRNRCSSSLGLFCHVPLKRDQGDWDRRLGLNATPNAIGCNGMISLLGFCQFVINVLYYFISFYNTEHPVTSPGVCAHMYMYFTTFFSFLIIQNI